LLLVYYYLIPNLVSFYSVPLFSALPLSIIIIAYSVLFVKGFGKSFLTFFYYCATLEWGLTTLPLLTLLLYHTIREKARWNNTQRFARKIVEIAY
jgi:hypothetical protein